MLRSSGRKIKFILKLKLLTGPIIVACQWNTENELRINYILEKRIK